MDEERHDTLREEARRQAPLPKWGQWKFTGREEVTPAGQLSRFLLLLLVIGVVIFLLWPR
jgi:hypothetical protein